MKEIRRLLILTLLLTCAERLSAQVSPVKFSDIEGLQQKEKRIVMVIIGTEWCKYCNAIKQTVLKNKKLTGTLERSFYTVFLNAEYKHNIFFAGREFKYNPSGVNTGMHELANELGTINKQLSFPSLCFLNEKNEIIYQHSGFLDPVSLASLLEKLSIQRQ